MEKEDKLPFGKKIIVGNFYIVKITKTLSKREINALRDDLGIPKEMRKHLHRSGLPYIVVSTMDEGWSVRFALGTTMYRFIEEEYGRFDDGGSDVLRNLFLMMYMDCTVLGDAAYLEDKGKALNAFIARQKAPEVDKAADDEILKAELSELNARETIKDMAKDVLEEENGK